jgi:hypothetical protein
VTQALRSGSRNSTLARTPGSCRVSWIRDADGGWHILDRVKLNDPRYAAFDGVYVIWHGGPAPNVVRIGQGIIRERLARHRTDLEVRLPKLLFKYELYVTWAEIAEPSLRDGIEAYLSTELRPQVVGQVRSVAPVIVNLPG